MSVLHALPTAKVVSAVLGAVVVGSMVVGASDRSVEATVVDVVDGDTIDVSYLGGEHRVRLLNIDTPESVDPEQPVECLGPEATQYLEQTLPPGTVVRLEYDIERRDGYGRELAGVYLGDRLVNADIAREGLGVAIAIGQNIRFLQDVRAGQAEAQRTKRGLYAEDVACTVPAQVTAVENAAAAEPMTASAAPADIAAAGEAIAQSLLDASALVGVLGGDPDAFPLLAFDADQEAALRGRVSTAQAALTSARDANAATLVAAQERVEAERRAAEEAQRAAEEAERAAAEEAARQAAEEAARQEAAEEAAEQVAEQRPTPAPRPSSPAPSSGGGSGSSGSSTPSSSAPSPSGNTPAPAPAPTGGSDGYTGCRAYGPHGTSVDDKGRRYTKIDCTTGLPIG
ncbi:thermonuclease family protein [Geodermatophilus sp. SYSU D01062]